MSPTFWSRVRIGRPDECWPFGNNRSYGVWRGKRANRVALEMSTGAPIPDGMLACHTCDNPPCVNPRHLFAGTHQDNMADMKAKRRHEGPHIGRPCKDASAIWSLLDQALKPREIALITGRPQSAIYLQRRLWAIKRSGGIDIFGNSPKERAGALQGADPTTSDTEDDAAQPLSDCIVAASPAQRPGQGPREVMR